MTNSVDWFQPECERPTLPAAGAVVFLDGALCEDLEPVEIVRNGWPEFGWARLVYDPAARADGNVISPEQIEDRFIMGTNLHIYQLYDATPPEATVTYLPLFVGHIAGIKTTISEKNETVEIIARDFSAVLDRITVYGQRVLQNDGAVAFLNGLETNFNPAGQGNAAPQVVATGGAISRLFAANAGQAKMWNCAEAIDYLLHEGVPTGGLNWPSLEELLTLTGTQLVRDLNVTGLSLLEAVHRCCERVGLRFRFVPCLGELGPAEALIFYRPGYGRAVEVNCQQKGQPLSPSRTSIGALHARRAFYPITHRYIGLGDFKMHEATFELVKAWDPTLESTNYDIFSVSANPEFCKVRDVYRKWCLNEAGDYTGAPYNQGDSYDFCYIFGDAGWVRRRRRFWPTLSTDAQGKPLGYFLEVSWDGEHWWTYPGAFDNLLDECGIRLGGDHLDVDTWVAALKGILRFRITASVVGDARLTCVLADGPVGSTVPVVDHVFTLPRQFRYGKVSPQSVLAEADGLGPPREVDDSAALHEFVRQQLIASPAVVERMEVQTLSLVAHVTPGDRVTSSPDGRDLLGCHRDNRSKIWIDRVHLDFQNQCTNLQLVRQRMYEG